MHWFVTPQTKPNHLGENKEREGECIILFASKYYIPNHDNEDIPFIDQILTVLSIPQLAMRYMSEGWKSWNVQHSLYLLAFMTLTVQNSYACL